MFAGKNLENFGGLLPFWLFNNFNIFQDTPFFKSKQSLTSNIITKKQKDFIITNNKEFYVKFKNEYNQNKELKNKYDELINEKKKLKNTIINLDKQLKNNHLSDNQENNYNNTGKEFNITPFRKKIRRKKSELDCKYECSFPHCNKKYFSKCSLNKHIKIKHQINNTDTSNLYN